MRGGSFECMLVHGRARFARRAGRAGNVLVWVACLLPLFGWAPAGVLYHCQVTGEVLTDCCCELERPVRPVAEPSSCCEEEEPKDSERDSEQDCDCCDILFEAGDDRTLPGVDLDRERSESAWEVEQPPTTATAAREGEAVALAPLQAEPPRCLLFQLFAVYRC